MDYQNKYDFYPDQSLSDLKIKFVGIKIGDINNDACGDENVISEHNFSAQDTEIRNAGSQPQDLEVGVIPNPTNDDMNLYIFTSKPENAQIRLVDISGKSIRLINHFISKGENRIVFTCGRSSRRRIFCSNSHGTRNKDHQGGKGGMRTGNLFTL